MGRDKHSQSGVGVGAPNGGKASLRLPFKLTVGVTGHRLGALAPERRASVEAEIAGALELVEAVVRKLHDRLVRGGAYDDEPLAITLVSPLADGADQIAAEAALGRGWRLHAMLPFERAEYARDFVDEDPAQTFANLVERADGVLELPGDRAEEPESYLLAGRGTVAHSDLLIALWDGAPPRGRGGTAEIVHLAVASGVPVIHISSLPGRPVELLWAAFDPHVITRNGHERTIRRPFEAAELGKVLNALIAPPGDQVEQRYIHQFLTEKVRQVRCRIEFPLLLSITGVKPLSRSSWKEIACAEAIAAEWRDFHEHCAAPSGVTAPMDLLERAYSWSDRLAGYYGQNFRSGHVFNFTLAALAALLGLSAFLLPHRQFELAVVEFLVASAVVANTMLGSRLDWQRRWLDYRQLAERLRPMRSLKLLGVAAPEHPGSATDPVPNRWVDWYAAGLWRAIGVPSGRIGKARAKSLIEAIKRHEIDSQIAYNDRSAEQAERLERRLGLAFGLLFGATMLTSFAVILGMKVEADWVATHQDWLTLVSAGLPAIATAIFGIRSQGDFAGSAQRSEATARTLQAIAARLDEEGGDLARSADLIEQAARAMLADLDEWRLVLKRSELEMA